MKEYLKLMRVHHYLKNILVILPLIFSGNITQGSHLATCFWGFFAFSFTCSIVYILNDIKDIEKDKLHKIKKNRPLACGKVSISEAWILIAILVILTAVCQYFTHTSNPFSFIFLIIYLIINIAYSWGLKSIPLIDVAILSAGFLIRVIYGASIINVKVSSWLYLTVMSMAFYLGFGKRRNEIKKQGSLSRDVLKYYNHNFLDKNMYMCLSLTIIFYALWTVDQVTTDLLIWTVPIVMLIVMKYSLNIEQDSYGDPVDVLLHDKTLMLLGVIYGMSILTILYLI